jgi:hypothetical protein
VSTTASVRNTLDWPTADTQGDLPDNAAQTLDVNGRGSSTQIVERQPSSSNDTPFATRAAPFAENQKTVASRAVLTELLAEWNGCVTEVDEGSAYFSAFLTGVKGEGVAGEEEDALIPVDDVSQHDLELLRPGNFFRLSVLYELDRKGQPRRFTQVVFRRLPAYRRDDLERAADRAREIVRGLRVG